MNDNKMQKITRILGLVLG